MPKKFLFAAMIIVLLGAVSPVFGFPAVEVYQKTSGSVVLIVAGSSDEASLIGAGSVLTDNGYAITNAHVVIDKETSKPYRNIVVFLKPDEVTGDMSKDLVKRFDAKVIAYDVPLDLAILKVSGLPRGAGIIRLADPKDIMVGEEVVAIGHPEQGGLWSLTYGRISGQIANQGKIAGKDVYQTDTSVNRGNSGGPLLDGRGYMVGVNTNIARLGEGNLPITGVNFALKASVVKSWLDSEGISIAYGSAPLHNKEEPIPPEAPSKESSKEVDKKPASAEKEQAPVLEKPAADVQKPLPSAEKPVETKPAIYKEEGASDKNNLVGKQDEKEIKSDTILTPKKPYAVEKVFKEVEKEMEDMMEEMRMKIRR